MKRNDALYRQSINALSRKLFVVSLFRTLLPFKRMLNEVSILISMRDMRFSRKSVARTPTKQ